MSVHPVSGAPGVHDPPEDPVNPPRHVTYVVCHNPHGVATVPRLINFTTSYVTPSSGGQLRFDDVQRRGYLTCHGIDHNPRSY